MGMNKFAIIIPYRDREHHLKIFVQYYKYLLPDADLFIIEQSNEKNFNRGKLLNIGFNEYGKKYEYCCFHDVDMLGIPGKVDYSYPKYPTHIATHASQFGYKMPYPNYFGGVSLIRSDQMIKVNGYSNEMWGWGCEDDEFHKNIVINGLVALRRECWFESLPHGNSQNNDLYTKNFQLLKSIRASTDGLSKCEYKILSFYQNLDYTKIIVSL